MLLGLNFILTKIIVRHNGTISLLTIIILFWFAFCDSIAICCFHILLFNTNGCMWLLSLRVTGCRVAAYGTVVFQRSD